MSGREEQTKIWFAVISPERAAAALWITVIRQETTQYARAMQNAISAARFVQISFWFSAAGSLIAAEIGFGSKTKNPRCKLIGKKGKRSEICGNQKIYATHARTHYEIDRRHFLLATEGGWEKSLGINSRVAQRQIAAGRRVFCYVSGDISCIKYPIAPYKAAFVAPPQRHQLRKDSPKYQLRHME